MTTGKITNMKGIARRWLINSVGVIVLMVVMPMGIMGFVQAVRNKLHEKAKRARLKKQQTEVS